MLDAWMWARAQGRARKAGRGLLESIRWTEGYRRIAEVAVRLLDTRLVSVANREANIVGLMPHARDVDHPADWVIRSQHNRALPEGGKAGRIAAADESDHPDF